MKLNILYEDNHLLVVEKPPFVLSQSDGSDTLDMLSLLKAYVKEKYHKPGNVYLGLVHRLDKEVGGIMIFARTSKAARRLSEQVRLHQMEKWYLAVVEGKMEDGVFEDYLVRDSFRSLIGKDKEGKFARLTYQVLSYQKNMSLVRIFLETGRHHQIRVQFSSHGHPLLGDRKYGKGEGELALYAYHLAFFHPVTKEKLIFEKIPNYSYFRMFSSALKENHLTE